VILQPPYPDREQVLLDVLSVLVDAEDVPILGVTRLPPDFEPPLYKVQRIGGGPDPWDNTDYALMRIDWYGETRDAAWQLSQAGEQVLLAHRGRTVERPGLPSDGMLIDYVELDVGGVMDPDLDPDDRRIIVNYSVGMRRQYHLLEV
jgi:hypothetical protein